MDAISRAGKETTPMGYKDRAKPLPMVYTDRLYNTLTGIKGSEPGEVIEMLVDLQKVITTTRGHEVNELWENMEKKFARNSSISTKASTDDQKVNVLLGVFYNAANTIDSKSVTTDDLTILKSIYEETQTYMLQKFRPNMGSKDKRIFDNITSLIESRMDAIGERFNEFREEGRMFGPEYV